MCGWDYTCVWVCVGCIWWPPPPLFHGEAYGTLWDDLGGRGSWHPHSVGYGWAAKAVFAGGLSGYPWEICRAVILPASPLCYLLVCLGILMVDRPSANKLRRSMSSPPDFLAYHPPLSREQAASCRHAFHGLALPPYYSLAVKSPPSTLPLLETNAHAHTPQPHGPRLSIKYAPHHCTPSHTSIHCRSWLVPHGLCC